MYAQDASPGIHRMSGGGRVSVLESEKFTELLERAGLGALPPRKLAAVAALALILLGLGLWRFWPQAPAPEADFDAGVAEATGGIAAEETSAPPAPDIVVHVVGCVMRPGVYSLAPGSRVDDAIRAAGGALGPAALESLNLARILADGEQVYVLSADQVAAGVPGEGDVAGAAGMVSGGAAGGVVDVNRATAAELEELPGVGPATAQKIVDDRTKNGPFKKPEDLMRVPGIGPSKFEAMKDMVTCG